MTETLTKSTPVQPSVARRAYGPYSFGNEGRYQLYLPTRNIPSDITSVFRPGINDLRVYFRYEDQGPFDLANMPKDASSTDSVRLEVDKQERRLVMAIVPKFEPTQMADIRRRLKQAAKSVRSDSSEESEVCYRSVEATLKLFIDVVMPEVVKGVQSFLRQRASKPKS